MARNGPCPRAPCFRRSIVGRQCTGRVAGARRSWLKVSVGARNGKCLMNLSNVCVHREDPEFPSRSHWSCPCIVPPKRFAAHRLAPVLCCGASPLGSGDSAGTLAFHSGPTRWGLLALPIVVRLQGRWKIDKMVPVFVDRPPPRQRSNWSNIM